MVNVASIFSTLGNPKSLIPLAIKDTASTTGMIAGSYVTGKEEGHDRFIDEVGTEALWLGGIPFFKFVYDKTVFKALGLDAKFDARNFKDKEILAKIEEYAPTEDIKANIKKITSKENLFKKAAAAKFFFSTILAVVTYIGLTKFKQKYTEKKIRENLIAEYNQQKDLQKENEKENTKLTSPSFKGIGSAIESFAFNPVKNMWLLDASITGERLADSRSKQEFIGYAIKEGSLLFFLYYAGGKIQELLEKQAEKKGKSISLDARVLEDCVMKDGTVKDGIIKEAFKNESVIKSLEEFKAANTSSTNLYEFLYKNPDNLVVKTAKMSDVISMYKEPQGLFNKARVTDKIDTRKYIDLKEVEKIQDKIELLYKQYKEALSRGETADKFFAQVKKLKRNSILKNIGTCILALGVVTPGIMLIKRLTSKDDQEFETKRQIREKLIEEGIIA